MHARLERLRFGYALPPLPSGFRSWFLKLATLYNRSSSLTDEPDPETILARIEGFLDQCRRPAALEYGEETIPLLAGQFALEIRSGRLSIEIWSANRSISRRIVDIERTSTGILDCIIHRFGNKPGRLTFMDLDRPQTAHRTLSGNRQSFGEQFRRMLTRQYPGWEIKTLTVAQDLRRSFSSLYPRAHLCRGRQRIAALACAEPELENDLLAFALIWHDYVRTTHDAEFTTRLALFLPQGCGNQTAHRLRWMNKDRLPFSIFLFNEHGSAGEVDAADLGNLQTALAAHPHEIVAEVPSEAEQIASGPPERWLETVVRAGIVAINPFLRREPIHKQVLTFAGCDRDIIDLLAVTIEGQLCVLELKVTEDLQLPIQALDYWMRISWHANRQELGHLFPDIALQTLAPKLVLLAPAMAFHSTNATLLRYFSSHIQVERVGVNSDWRQELRVVLRLEGAAQPASHQI